MSKKDDYVDISSYSQLNRVYKKKHNKGRTVRIVALVISIVLLLGGCGLIYYYQVLDSLKFEEVETTNKNDETIKTLETTVDDSTLLSSSKVLNILLFGQDAKESEEEKYGRSDTTILLSLDNVNKKIKLTSFQRDTYVTIPGHGQDKLNAAFYIGGVQKSIETIEANFGVKVDKYAIVDFRSFIMIIDVLGGVDIDLTLDEIGYINAQIDVNDDYDVTTLIEYDPTLPVQTIHLDGEQALWYARDRGADALGDIAEYSFTGDDWDRTSRQRNLIRVLTEQLKEKASLTDLVQIVNKVGPLVTTNLKKSDITFLVSNVSTYLNYDIAELSIPTEGTWGYSHTENGQSVIYIYDWDKVRLDLASFIYEDQVSVGSTTSTTNQNTNY